MTGQWIIISGIGYQIASVTSNTALTLATSAGVQAGVGISMSAYMGAIISNNYSYNNGGENSGGVGAAVGPGFYNELSDGNAYSNNIAENAWLDGYINFYSSFVSYNGDKAFSNGRGATVGNEAGFNNIGGFETSYNGVTVGSHTAITPVGFYIANSQNTNIYSISNHATTPLSNAGTNTTYAMSSGTQAIGPFSIGGGAVINTTTAIPQIGTSTAGQASCIKSAAPPVLIGYCSTAVSGAGACTCN